MGRTDMDINNNRTDKRGGVATTTTTTTTTAAARKRHKNELQQNCAKTPINLSKVEAQKRNENSKGKALKEKRGSKDCNEQREKDGRIVLYCGVYITLSVFILTVRCQAGEAWQLASVSHAQGQQVGVSPLFHLARTLPGKSYELRLYLCVCVCAVTVQTQ